MGARGCPVPDEVLQSLRHADSLGGPTGLFHNSDMLVQLLLADAVEIHGVAHDVVAELLILFEQLGNVGKLLAVLDRSLEELYQLAKPLLNHGSAKEGAHRFLLPWHVAIQSFQPAEFRLLGISVGGESSEGLKEAMARMVFVPGAVVFA